MRVPQPVGQFQKLQSSQNNKRAKGNFGRKRNRRKEAATEVPDTLSSANTPDTTEQTWRLDDGTEVRELAASFAELRLRTQEISLKLQEWGLKAGVSHIEIGNGGRVIIVNGLATHSLDRTKLMTVLLEKLGLSPELAKHMIDQASKPVLRQGYVRYIKGKNSVGDETES